MVVTADLVGTDEVTVEGEQLHVPFLHVLPVNKSHCHPLSPWLQTPCTITKPNNSSVLHVTCPLP